VQKFGVPRRYGDASRQPVKISLSTTFEPALERTPLWAAENWQAPGNVRQMI
jgi:hypothetical protein